MKYLLPLLLICFVGCKDETATRRPPGPKATPSWQGGKTPYTGQRTPAPKPSPSPNATTEPVLPSPSDTIAPVATPD